MENNMEHNAAESENSFFQDFFCTQNILETALKWWKLILAFAVAGAVAATVLTFFMKPVFTAKSSMFAWRFESDADKGYQRNSGRSYHDLAAALMLVNDYRELLNSQRVRERLKSHVESAFPEQNGKQLCYSVKINNANESRVLFIEATAANPEVACFVANETANILSETISEVLLINNVQIIDNAKKAVPTGKRSLKRNLPLGLFGGLAFGLAVAMVIAFFDQTIKDPEQARRYVEGSIIGSVPLVDENVLKGTSLQKLLDSHEQQELAESFRLLRANLPYLAVNRGDGEARVFMSTSTIAHEGKSNCISAIAALTAKAGKRVLIIDCDLRKPTIHRIFKINSKYGVVSVLSGEAKPEQAIVKIDKYMDVMPCGPIPPNPSELLMSSYFEAMLKDLRNSYDYIFVDTTPLLFLTDPLIIAPFVDGVLFLLACNQAKIGLIRRAMRMLRQIVPDKPIGVVINRFNHRSAMDYSYRYSSYYSYYRSGYSEKPAAEGDGNK